jgi:hypothetical protein
MTVAENKRWSKKLSTKVLAHIFLTCSARSGTDAATYVLQRFYCQDFRRFAATPSILKFGYYSF